MSLDSNNAWQFDFDLFEQSINEKTKVVFLNNPHNPSGKVFDLKDMERLTDILNKHPNIYVICDEVYYLFPFDRKQHYSFANFDQNFKKTITVFSAGKMLNVTGWKVGWCIGPENLIKAAG